jgi:hypothetical protein
VISSGKLLGGQLKHEILWKTHDIPFNGLDKSARLYVIKLCQVRAEHDLLPTYEKYERFDAFHRNKAFLSHQRLPIRQEDTLTLQVNTYK